MRHTKIIGRKPKWPIIRISPVASCFLLFFFLIFCKEEERVEGQKKIEKCINPKLTDKIPAAGNFCVSSFDHLWKRERLCLRVGA